MKGTAKHKWQISDDTDQKSALYYIIPKIKYTDNYGNRKIKSTDYIIVSAISDTQEKTGPQTFIFPADSFGNVLDWHELSGSIEGEMNINKALKNAGYLLTDEKNSKLH